MSTPIRLTLEEFQKLPDEDCTRYKLDQGELLMEPSPTFLHNRIRDRIARRLYEFVEDNHLGEIIVEMDFRLAPDTVRSPNVAFVTSDHLRMIDLNRSPVEGAPAVAVEVISPSNLAEDTAKKVGQSLSAGSHAVWVVYPALSMVEIHQPTHTRQVKGTRCPHRREGFCWAQVHSFTCSSL